MAKSLPLSDDQKRLIISYAQQNPHVKKSDVCRHFNITRNQYEFALKKYNEGMLYKTKPRKRVRRKPIEDLVQESSPEELLNKEFAVAVAQLHTDVQLDAGQRIDMLSKLVSTRQTMQRISLQAHIKRADAELFGILVRIFKPDATDEEVIRYYTQAYEEYKQLR